MESVAIGLVLLGCASSAATVVVMWKLARVQRHSDLHTVVPLSQSNVLEQFRFDWDRTAAAGTVMAVRQGAGPETVAAVRYWMVRRALVQREQRGTSVLWWQRDSRHATYWAVFERRHHGLAEVARVGFNHGEVCVEFANLEGELGPATWGAVGPASITRNHSEQMTVSTVPAQSGEGWGRGGLRPVMLLEPEVRTRKSVTVWKNPHTHWGEFQLQSEYQPRKTSGRRFGTITPWLVRAPAVDPGNYPLYRWHAPEAGYLERIRGAGMGYDAVHEQVAQVVRLVNGDCCVVLRVDTSRVERLVAVCTVWGQLVYRRWMQQQWGERVEPDSVGTMEETSCPHTPTGSRPRRWYWARG